MAEQPTTLKERIATSERLLLAEISPPQSGDPTPLREAARRYAGKIHALGVNDNPRGACMSALAAAAIVAKEGVEPILHIATRDRNRTALVADYLGAQALGIGNALCTTGTHHTLGPARAARAVFDVDSVQLLEMYTKLPQDGSVVGAERLNGAAPLCLGAVASPFSDPAALQLLRLAKKVKAGASFLITQPVFDLDRFSSWWTQQAEVGLRDKVALLAGIQVLTSAEAARELAQRRPNPRIPDAVLAKVTEPKDPGQQRSAGIEIAVKTIEQLSKLQGLRGFELRGDGDHDAVLEVIDKAGLKAN